MTDALIENIKDCPWWRCRDSGECRGVTFGGCRDRDAIAAFRGQNNLSPDDDMNGERNDGGA